MPKNHPQKYRIYSILKDFLTFRHPPILKDSSEVKTSATEDEKVLEPRSKDAFFQRVATFSTLTWFAKPASLSPLHCAQYGWENTDTDILRCTSCRAVLCVKLADNDKPERYKEQVKRLEESLSLAHQKHCSWKLNPNPESFLQLELTVRSESLEHYSDRLEALMSLGKLLPRVKTEFLKAYDTTGIFDHLRALRKNCTRSGLLIDHMIEQSATAIALCGWTKSPSSSSIVAMVRCTYCKRQIGLWNFTSVDSTGSSVKTETPSDSETSHVNGEDGEPAAKKMKTEHKVTLFDPSSQHKYWCRWACQGSTQETQPQGASPPSSPAASPPSSPSTGSPASSAPSPESPAAPGDDAPGWVRLLVLLIPDLIPGAKRKRIIGDINSTPPHKGLRSVRYLFQEWSSPPKVSP